LSECRSCRSRSLRAPIACGIGGLRLLGVVAAAATLMAAQPSYGQASPPDAGLAALIAAAKAEGTVMIYHTSAERTFKPVLSVFAKKYGIAARNFYATGTPLSVRFESEVASNNIQADVFYASDPTIFSKQSASFQKLDAVSLPGYSALPDNLRLSNGLAVSSVQLAYAMFYNTRKVSGAERPRTWKDLADRKWKGQTLLIDPRSSVGFRAPYNVIRTIHPGILAQLADNDLRIVRSGTSAVQQLAAGTGSIAYVGYPVHAIPTMAKGAPVRWATIEDPIIARRTWIGAVRGPKPNAARLLVHFLTSIEGLKAYCAGGDGSMALLDPQGKRTGCEPLSANAHFLSEQPMSAADSKTTLGLLRMQ
jgi:iron(III) transport system substrate-binding protein